MLASIGRSTRDGRRHHSCFASREATVMTSSIFPSLFCLAGWHSKKQKRKCSVSSKCVKLRSTKAKTSRPRHLALAFGIDVGTYIGTMVLDWSCLPPRQQSKSWNLDRRRPCGDVSPLLLRLANTPGVSPGL